MRGDTRNTSSTDAGGNAVTTRWRTIDSRDGCGGGGDARHELRRRALHFGRGRAALGGGVGSAGGGASRLRHGVMIGRSLRQGMPCRWRQYGRRTRAPCACGAGRPAELDAAAMRCARVAASLAILLLGCERPVDCCSPTCTIKVVLPVLIYFPFFSSRPVHDASLHALGVCRHVCGALCSFCSLPFFSFFSCSALLASYKQHFRTRKRTVNGHTRTRLAVHSIVGWPTHVLTYELAVQETQTDQQQTHTWKREKQKGP